MVVAQHDPAESTDVPLQHLRMSGERTYGRVRFTFFARGLLVTDSLS